jgi:3-phosphoshikimate 1-carboxyvinyltransferase
MKPGSSVTVRPAQHFSGGLRLPGDKSISHRYAMLGSLAEGKSRFENYSTGADCASTLACMRQLGVRWEPTDASANVIEIEGRGLTLSAPSSALDCGNSGSTMRMLSGILAGQDFTSEVFGDESLSRRPMARIMKPLGEMGARIASAEGERPPLRITGGRLKPIHYKMPVASAQVKSCLLRRTVHRRRDLRGRAAADA